MVDLLPSQIGRWQRVEMVARKHFQRASLKEIRTPLLEATDLFARGIGEYTDVVGKEMYSFLDKGDRSCTLRPEGTASVVRAVVQHGLLTQGAQRLWYGGPMFRYERPQAGRQRQFHQLGVEFLGLSSIRSDAELIAIAWDLLNELGLEQLTLQINTLGTSDDRKNYRKQLSSWLEGISDVFDDESLSTLQNNPLRILDTKKENIQKLLIDAPLLEEYLCNSSKERFNSLQRILNELHIPFVVNKKLVRGLDYYSHTAFEITSDNLGAQSTVCGGGRYDGLIEQLGGTPTPAIGWAIGMERLLMLIDDKNTNNTFPDVYLINRGVEAEIEALCIARNLRRENFSVEIDNSGGAFGKQFKRASRSKATWAIVIGDEEILNGEIRLKKLTSLENNFKEISFKRSEFGKLIKALKS